MSSPRKGGRLMFKSVFSGNEGNEMTCSRRFRNGSSRSVPDPERRRLFHRVARRLRSGKRAPVPGCHRRSCRAASTVEYPGAMPPQHLDHQPRITKLAEVAWRAIDSRDRYVHSRESRACCTNDEVRLELVAVAHRLHLPQHLRLDCTIPRLTVAHLAAGNGACGGG